ncbi:MAG: pilus assembly PilX N-terminal domain-containing protein [Alkaliphilus sp.]
MIKKIIKSNKGSTLGLVLVTLMVLSMIGVSLMSIGLINYRIKMTEERIQASFYLAESGLDQAYGIILEEVSEAIRLGNIEVNIRIDEFIVEQRRLERLYVDDGGTSGGGIDSIYILNNQPGNTINPYGHVNVTEVNDAKDDNRYTWVDLFQTTFTQHIDTSLLNLKLVDPANYEVIHTSVPTVSEIGVFTPFASGGDYLITLASSFVFEGTTQAVQLDFTINEPTEILADYFMETHVVQIPKSPIWDNVLVADNNIHLSGGHSEIRGDVYANAVLSTSAHAWDVNDSRIGGIVVGTDSSGTMVNNSSTSLVGNVFTNSFLQIRSDTSSAVITGDAFLNSLVLQETTDNSSITLNGTLLTLDDIELNGKNANILIDGNFYGFSDGSAGTRHDQTSSIVINSDDINDFGGSSINITGDSFLGGVVHVGLTNILYQTGEGVSLKGNFRAYSVPLGRTLHTYQPFALINRNLLVHQKAQHFVSVNAANPGFLQTGHSASTIELGNVLQSIGAYIDGGAIRPLNHDALVFEPIRNAKTAEYANALTLQYDYSRIFSGNTEVIEPLNASSEIVYITTGDVSIIGNGGTALGIANETIMPSGDTVLTGIIITEGDVYIRGAITFRGLIVAGGNIFVEDTNTKLFRTDLGFILRKVHENANIEAVFIDEVPQNLLTFTYLSTVGTVDPEALKATTDLVEITEWQKTN